MPRICDACVSSLKNCCGPREAIACMLTGKGRACLYCSLFIVFIAAFLIYCFCFRVLDFVVFAGGASEQRFLV